MCFARTPPFTAALSVHPVAAWPAKLYPDAAIYLYGKGSMLGSVVVSTTRPTFPVSYFDCENLMQYNIRACCLHAFNIPLPTLNTCPPSCSTSAPALSSLIKRAQNYLSLSRLLLWSSHTSSLPALRSPHQIMMEVKSQAWGNIERVRNVLAQLRSGKWAQAMF